MGLNVSGSINPNVTGLAGGLQDVIAGGTNVTGVIYALLDCRNINGITFSEDTVLPQITAISGGVARLEFAFYKSNRIPYNVSGGTIRFLSDGPTYPIAGGSLTASVDLIQRYSYRYTNITGTGPLFQDIVPVLGPWCVVSIYTSGVNTLTLSSGAGNSNNAFTPLLLGNTRSDYTGIHKGQLVFSGGQAVGAGVTVSVNIDTILSGEVFLEGTSGSSAATQSLGLTSNFIERSGVAGAGVMTRVIPDGAGNFLQTRVVVPRGWLSLAIFNGTAGVVNYTYRIYRGSF